MRNTVHCIRKSLKVKAAALTLCAAALLASGCGGTVEEPSIPIVIATPEPSPQPIIGGRLRLPMPANADINDPLCVDTEEMLGMYGLIFEPLIEIDENNRLVPCLAETWTCDDTGKIWTIALRKNVIWHGSDATLLATAVVNTWEAIRELGDESYYSYALDRIESIAAEGLDTVVVTMKERGMMSLYALDFPIILTSALDGEVPIGTGPYCVASHGGGSVTLKINESWWKTSPYIESIQFYERDSNDTAIASYEAGQLDMVLTSRVSAGRLREEGVTKVSDADTQLAELMLFNFSTGFFNNVSMRKALCYAIDRSAIITSVYMNHATEVDVPVPPYSWLYDSASKRYDYDPDLALSLLSESGWTDRDGDGLLENRSGTELALTLLVNETLDNTLRREAAGQVAADLLEVGITVTVVTKPHALGESDSEYMKALADGEYDIAMLGFSLGRDGDLSALLSSEGESNFTKYSGGVLDKLLDDMRLAGDEAALREASAAFQEKYLEDLPLLVLYFRRESIVYSAELDGLVNVVSPNMFRTAARWYLATDAE